jgi:hypothetical protein
MIMKQVLKDLTNQKFGCYTVLNRAEVASNEAVWNCKCVCGIIKEVRGSKLRNGRTKSCGSCYRKGKPLIAARKDTTALQTAYKRCQQSAERRHISFELTREEAKELFLGDCQYCGASPSKIMKLNRIDTAGDINFNGIDRINSNIGYTVSNTASCCTKCNYAKHIMDLGEFKSWVRDVYTHLNIGNSWADKK